MSFEVHLGRILVGTETTVCTINVLFNDAFNTVIWDHSDRQGLFYIHLPTDRIAHTKAFVTPVVGHWLEREIAQWVRLRYDIQVNLSDTVFILYLHLFQLIMPIGTTLDVSSCFIFSMWWVCNYIFWINYSLALLFKKAHTFSCLLTGSDNC